MNKFSLKSAINDFTKSRIKQLKKMGIKPTESQIKKIRESITEDLKYKRQQFKKSPNKDLTQMRLSEKSEESKQLRKIKIDQKDKALKGYTKSFEIKIKNKKDPLIQLQNTRKAIEQHIKKLLIEMKGLKFIETLRITSKKISNGQIFYDTTYFNSKPQTIINNLEIIKALQLSKQQILNIISQSIANGSNWIVESVENHYLNVVKYEPIKRIIIY